MTNRPAIGAVLVCLALVAAACGSGGSNPEPTPTDPRSTGSDAPAVRDLYDLAQRFRGAANIPRQVSVPPPAAGQEDTFEVLVLPRDPDEEPERTTITAALRAVADHAYFYVETGAGVDDGEVLDAADAFESEVWPVVTGAFGLPPDPGVDGDPHVVVLHTDLGSSLGGYVSPEDGYPKALLPHSNQREMVYLNVGVRPLGSQSYARLLAHELQHLIHVRNDATEEIWLNEGLSEYAGNLVSREDSFHSAFLDVPDTQLNDWTEYDDPTPHYGAASLFVSYLLEQTGGSAHDLASLQSNGLTAVRELLSATGSTRSLEQIVSDWAVANVLDQPEGPYAHLGPEAFEPLTTLVEAPGSFDGDVHQFAADYLEITSDEFSAPVTVTFDGRREVPVAAAQATTTGTFWWAGRADDVDSTLTREIDLTGVERATLTFRTWFDIERWFDHGYVTASRDGGRTWEVLLGTQSTRIDPLDVSYGPSYSGLSGGDDEPRWMDERIDLTRYAGSKVLLRFEYVTDGGFTRPGWLIDDIAVPEIGFLDDAETDTAGWRREGFRRLGDELPQKLSLRLITFGDEPAVQDIPLDTRNHASFRLDGLGTEYNRAVVAVVALTEGTTEPARYQYSVQPATAP